MTMFFLDLWHDLREKRLWPVAVGLLAAIIAIPAVLFKPASDAAPRVVAVPKTNAAETLPVVAVDAGPTVGSRLEAFNAKNPFKPMKDLAKEAAASGPPSGPSDSSSSTARAGGGGSTDGGSLPSSLGAGAPSGGSDGSGASPSPSTTPSSTPAPPPTKTTKTTEWFHYTADFTFGEAGSGTTFESAPSFTLLPDKAKAQVMFVGVTDDGESAVFFIADPAFTATGEGKCNAEGDACRYVALKIGESSDEETFSAVDGSVSYDLQLKSIQREKLSSTPKAAADTTDPSPKETAGLEASGDGVSMTTQTVAQSSKSLLPDLMVGGPGVLRVSK